MKTKKVKAEKYPKYWFYKDYDGMPTKFTVCDCVIQYSRTGFGLSNPSFDVQNIPNRVYDTWIEVPKHEVVLLLGYLP